ncbi:MAG TPA: IS481 family transposase [Thalassospira sp.]|uniref:IS481 family transposase n=1 Tax=Thalassospira sp. UBA848 TaxID=1947677 RepID=UPI000EBE6DA3|nr:IS481 family transposase [Thalassospira sp. UBA848]HAI29781.1 IS481 family transposase [Thalassospira sp.]
MPAEALLALRTRLSSLPARDPGRASAVARTAELYGLSISSVYRQLRDLQRPKGLQRSDRGVPRAISQAEMERYCEIVAALKIRTENGKGHKLSTNEAIRLLEDHGVETPEGFVQAPKNVLAASTLNRWLRTWGYDHPRMIRGPAAVRFQARYSNELWHFDMSPSDLKELDQPEWIEPGRGAPTLMLYSVVDDRSGVAYQEYRCVYGEDAESALRFLFNAMAPKEGTILQGRPVGLYLDNGPVAKSIVFQTVMGHLGVDWRTHMPRGSDGRRVTARSKGKVERPFLTVKEAHETLYHFHRPKTEAEANSWLLNFINRYNDKPHRHEAHGRAEDWCANLPEQGLREMCSWERYCAFAREPERRTVAADARINLKGAYYEVDPDLAGEAVLVWWGVFDQELFVEFGSKRYGPYRPVGGPIPLHRYRKQSKSPREKRADKVANLAARISIPRSALAGPEQVLSSATLIPLAEAKFEDPDPWHQFSYASTLDARRGIADLLEKPLARLSAEDLEFIEELVTTTINKREIATAIKTRFGKNHKT